MSHRKFEHPRCGSLEFLPRKRAARMRGRIKAFPEDDKTQKPHFTGFLGFKAGMTHIVRDIDRSDCKWLHKREVCEPVTIIEAPPLVCVGLVGYIETPVGLRALKTVWTNFLSEECRRRFYRHWIASKNKAFAKYNDRKYKGDKKDVKADAKAEQQERPKAEQTSSLKRDIANIVKHATVVRAIVHTQPSLVKLGPKKAHIAEIQINGGSTADKVKFATDLFEQQVRVSSVFQDGDLIDAVAVNSGKGWEGVVTRWGVTRLPRKTHRGLRRVACIGAWHPARVRFTVARAGQNGCHHRTEINKKIYKVGAKEDKDLKAEIFDYTKKPITPMGGFVWYGPITNDYLMVKGSIPGPRKRIIAMRKPLRVPRRKWMLEKITLKFIDTSSKLGHGKFQSSAEKTKFLGVMKKDKQEVHVEGAPEKKKVATAEAAAKDVEAAPAKKQEKPAAAAAAAEAPKKAAATKSEGKKVAA